MRAAPWKIAGQKKLEAQFRALVAARGVLVCSVQGHKCCPIVQETSYREAQEPRAVIAFAKSKLQL
jgi:hypothetical protein